MATVRIASRRPDESDEEWEERVKREYAGVEANEKRLRQVRDNFEKWRKHRK